MNTNAIPLCVPSFEILVQGVELERALRDDGAMDVGTEGVKAFPHRRTQLKVRNHSNVGPR